MRCLCHYVTVTLLKLTNQLSHLLNTVISPICKQNITFSHIDTMYQKQDQVVMLIPEFLSKVQPSALTFNHLTVFWSCLNDFFWVGWWWCWGWGGSFKSRAADIDSNPGGKDPAQAPHFAVIGHNRMNSNFWPSEPKELFQNIKTKCAAEQN